MHRTSKYLRSTPHPVTVTTRIITFLVGNPYKPSFATVTGWGADPTNTQAIQICILNMAGLASLLQSLKLVTSWASGGK